MGIKSGSLSGHHVVQGDLTGGETGSWVPVLIPKQEELAPVLQL